MMNKEQAAFYGALATAGAAAVAAMWGVLYAIAKVAEFFINLFMR